MLNILSNKGESKLELEIKKLSPDLVDEYLHFFDETPHDDGVPDHTCYCVNWCSENQRERVADPCRKERRALACQYIQNGNLQGYLAYVNGKIVGWCNANMKTECLDCYGWFHFMTEVNELAIEPTEKVKSIFCFVIVPWMQRKGSASQLLEFICEDAKKEGFDYVEAYPFIEETNPYDFYVGFQKLYEKMGFRYEKKTKHRFVMRKTL